MIFLHGFSDHCNRYYDFFPTVAKSGILVHAFDQRGWGRSVKKPTERGLTGPSSMVMADITSIIKSHLPCSAPLFLMGHSMGGQETLFYASTGPAEIKKQITGFLAAAPYIRLDPSSEPNKVTVFAGRLASKMLPHMQLLQKLQPQWTSRDPAVCKSWEEDELCHNTGTLEGLAGMLDRAAALDTGAVELDEDCHVWIGHGTDDHITDYRASKSFYERSKARDKLLKLYDECYHCSELMKTQTILHGHG